MNFCPFCGFKMEWEENWGCDICPQCRARGPVTGDAYTRNRKGCAPAIKDFFAEVEHVAESKMLKTGKLEGAHYAAMKELLSKL